MNTKNMKRIFGLLSLGLLLGSTSGVYAHVFDPTKSTSTTHSTGQTPEEKSTSAGCLPPSTSAELNVNNVRALIHSGGDMWWDLISNARYEVPKGSGKHSLYVGNLWIGGREAQTQTLKVAAQRYRTNGVDYWTGPLDTLGSAAIDAETCDLYDQLWQVSRQDVELFRLCNCLNPNDPSCEGYQVPESIKKWPGNPILQSNGQHLQMQNTLAPFYDNAGDGVYDYTDCDYPFYDLDNTVDCKTNRSALLYGDFTLWWVFNDKGNIHGESQGNAIGMEIRAQGFGFNTNDEINNMTFYNYQLINRGTTTLEQCYFGVNTDADIGGAIDDYTGCDVERGFGFMYNADDFDNPYSGAQGYGANPPAIGIDFFLGPYMDDNGLADFWDKTWDPNNPPPVALAAMNLLAGDAQDTTRINATYGINGIGFDDTIPDNERFGMRRFVYYNNSGAVTGDPATGPEYYNYLRGFWKDNSRMVYGCNGYPSGSCAGSPKADFMFPGDSDPWNWGTKGVSASFSWSETNTGGSPNPNQAGDRRFVQSAGPFTLKPGAVNDITTGVVWARSSSGNSYESVLKVLAADLKAQSLFENCFKVLNGPDAPDLNIQEMDQELVMFLTNKSISNNYLNQYEELNYFIPEFALSSTAITHDTTVWVPQFDSTNVGGTAFYLYQNPQPAAYDSLFILYVGMTPVDSLYGYLTNQSIQVATTIQTGVTIDTNHYDRQIRFEGYLIYQVKNKTVTATDIFGSDGSSFGRLVAQCDIRNFDANGNPIAKIINFEYNDGLGYSVPVVKVDGENQGIKHSFKITQDEFTLTSSKTLVNHKDYYYMALAYGYNNYKKFDPNDATALDGQKEPFFLGRRNIKVYKATPHINTSENGGTVLNSLYGFGPQITRIEGRGNGGNILELTKETEDAIMSAPDFRKKTLTYENGLGPIKVKIIDPLVIKGKKYVLKVLDTALATVKNTQYNARWVLLDPSSPSGQDTVAKSESNLSQAYEQIIYDRRAANPDTAFLGFSIDVHQVINAGPSWTNNTSSCQAVTIYTDPGAIEVNGTELSTPGNGLLYSSIEFENSENVYLGFFQDLDGDTPLNWARAGSTSDDNSTYWNSNYFETTVCSQAQKIYFDPQGKFITGTSFYGGGGMVPYILTSSTNSYKQDPAATQSFPGHNLGYSSQINASGKIIPNTAGSYIGSIDIVLTDDKTKWSRCPVFETYNVVAGNSNDASIDPGFPNTTPPKNMDLRFAFSVDKEGNKNFATTASSNPDDPNYLSAYGMGWFPGYAINIETGERLNIAFGEDSYLNGENGRDMVFNPSDSDPLAGNYNGYIGPFGDYLFAGKHYMYVFESNITEGAYSSFPNYDGGLKIVKFLSDTTNNFVPISGVSIARARNVWRNCIWAGIPFNVAGKTWLGGEARIKLRVQKSYSKDYSAINPETAPVNANNPMYEFTFEGLETVTGNNTSAVSALDIIQIVPNPYYSANEYETSALDNRVKIVNLPDECTISIYTLSGTLIRTLVKDDRTSTSVAWDMKNFKNIPVSTGLYIVHINAPGIGEKILKWYGVLRPLQLDNY
jgi:hypothetical protein